MHLALIEYLLYLKKLHRIYELQAGSLTKGSDALESCRITMRMMNTSYIATLGLANKLGVNVLQFDKTLE